MMETYEPLSPKEECSAKQHHTPEEVKEVVKTTNLRMG